MAESPKSPSHPSSDRLPFPAEWLHTAPARAEAALRALSLEDQARCALMLFGRERQDFLMLCPQAPAVIQALPPEEVYLTVKEIGEKDALPVLSVLSTPQVQMVLDLECWAGDKFLPERCWHWLELLDQANDRHLLHWFQTEEFEQKVMVLQSLLRVFNCDDAADGHPGVEHLVSWSPDGVYELYFKVEASVPVLKRVLTQMVSEDPELFRSLMVAVNVYPVTPTVERAWQWRLSRTAERGLPDFEEAFGVYSILKPEALRERPNKKLEFDDGPGAGVAPRFVLCEADPASFLGQCLALMKNQDRFDAVCWELMILANKVLVADRVDLGNLSSRRATLRKTLGYVNLGLELGAGGDIARGEKLLNQTWLQALFQVGYAACMRLKWDAETLLREKGRLLKKILNPVLQEHLLALIDRFPKIGVRPLETETDRETPEIHWRDVASEADLERLRRLLGQWRFETRFVQMALGLSESELDRRATEGRFPPTLDELDTLTLTLTAFAHYTLFGTVASEPLADDAAQSFLQMVFLPSPYPQDEPVVNPDRLEPFQTRLLEGPLAWTKEDRGRLQELLAQMSALLVVQFGRLNPRQSVDWQFTRGLWIK